MLLEKKLRRVSGWLGLIVATLGLLTLAGWITRTTPLAFLPFNSGPLKPSSALCLMLAGTALWLRLSPRSSWQRAGLAGIGLALLIEVVGLMQRLFDFDLRIDRLLAGADMGGRDFWTGRMSLHASLGLILITVAIMTLGQERNRKRWPVSAWLANLVIGLSAAAMISLEFALSTTVTSPLRMSTHLALALFLLAVGTSLARPEDRHVRILFERSTAGLLARRLLFAVAIIPLGFGAAIAAFVGRGQLAPADGAVLLVTAMIVAGFGVALFSIDAAVDIHDSREEAEGARLLLTAQLQEQAAQLHVTVARRTQELSNANTSLKAVAESNALLAIVAQKTTNGVVIADPTGRVEWTNAAFARLTGYTLDEMKGRKPGHLLQGSATDAAAIGRLREAERGGQPCNVEILNYTKGGEPFWQIIDMQPVRDTAGELAHFIAIHTDITARKQLEQRLHKSEELASEVGRLAQIGGWEIDLATSQITWSAGTRRIHEVDETFQPTLASTAKFFTPETHAIVRASFDGVSPAAPAFDIEVPLLTALGRGLWVRILGRGEFRQGATASLHGAIQDVTAQHEGEEARRRLETQLFQAQKMETLGTFAGGIAHDFNNLLTGIIGYHELAADSVPEDHPARMCLNEARNASLRARELVEQILAFGRQGGNAEHGPLDLVPVIDEVRRFLRATLPANIAIEVECAEGCGRVLADGTQIHQVLLNLGSNAGHAMRQHGGVLRITLGPAEIGLDVALALGKHAAGRYVRLSVSDTGHGMDEATRSRIFDPFFTTKNSREGTGLGLAVVHGIVHSHRGAITVESAPGSGATFHVHLPAAGDEAEVGEQTPQAAPHGHGEFVCVVDDEEVVGSCTKLVLENKGYRTLVFRSAEHCLAHLQSDTSHCAVLVTDQTMPGMQGIELAATLRQITPTLPVVIMSGYFSKISADELARLGQVELLSKPFTTDELAHAVHRALHSTGGLG